MILVFPPDSQRIKPPVMLTSSMFRLMSSLTRMPVAYKTSSIALSRQPFISLVRGCSRRSSTSFPVRICGSFFSAFSTLMLCTGFFSISSSDKANRYRLLSEARHRDTVAGDFPIDCSHCMYALTTL